MGACNDEMAFKKRGDYGSRPGFCIKITLFDHVNQVDLRQPQLGQNYWQNIFLDENVAVFDINKHVGFNYRFPDVKVTKRKEDFLVQFFNSAYQIYSLAIQRELIVGDQFTIGDTNVQVKNIQLTPRKQTPISKEKIILQHNDKICRLCREIRQSPFVRVCSCQQLQNVHLQCVKNHMLEFIQSSESTKIIKPLDSQCKQCEEIMLNTEMMNQIVEMDHSQSGLRPPYVVLEATYHNEKTLYFSSFNNLFKPITIGRSKNNMIKMQDSNISQENSFLMLKEGKIYLSDNNSRRGTRIKCSLNGMAFKKEYQTCRILCHNLYFEMSLRLLLFQSLDQKKKKRDIYYF